jgi:hypothetical protein
MTSVDGKHLDIGVISGGIACIPPSLAGVRFRRQRQPAFLKRMGYRGGLQRYQLAVRGMQWKGDLKSGIDGKNYYLALK